MNGEEDRKNCAHGETSRLVLSSVSRSFTGHQLPCNTRAFFIARNESLSKGLDWVVKKLILGVRELSLANSDTPHEASYPFAAKFGPRLKELWYANLLRSD